VGSNQFLYDLPKPKKTIGKRLLDVLQVIVIIFAIFIVFYLFIFIPNQVDGQSMMPNFRHRELLFTNKIIQMIGDKDYMAKYDYNYKPGDVVIFQKPGNADFIKRVIGLPGDAIMIKDGHIYRNGLKMIEYYIPQDPRWTTYIYTTANEGETIYVPDNHYFLVGDNRNNSYDSRYDGIGPVPREYIKGKVVIRWWPLDRMGLIKRGAIDYER
jgi:signal peptidase I